MNTRFVVLALLLCMPAVSAIGVSPATVRLEFEPNQHYDFSIQLFNYNAFPVEAEIRPETLGVVEIKQPIIIPAKSSTTVPVRITLPATLSRPGMSRGYIFFKEHYDEDTTATFPIRTEVGLGVEVWEPYPGLYAEMEMSAQPVEEKTDGSFHVVLHNYGSQNITGGIVRVRVVSLDGALQDEFTMPGITIVGNTDSEFNHKIPSATYKPGKYILEGTFDYGASPASVNSSFIVGTQDVDVLGVSGPFYLDTPVNKFAIQLESLWNQPMESVYATFQLGATKTSTSPIMLNAFSTDTLTGYWETDKTVPTGLTNALVTVYFPGGKSEKLVPVTVYNETPRPVAPTQESPLKLTGYDLAFSVLAIILVFCIILFALHRHQKTDDPPQQPPVS